MSKNITEKTPKKIELALSKFQKGKPDDALEIIERILSKTPNHAFSWFLSAIIHSQKGNANKAINGFNQALKFQPIYPEALNNLGVALESKNKRQEAESAYKKAIKQRKGYANAHYNLANIQKNNADFATAIENYLLAIKHKPDYVNAMNNLALIHQHYRDYKKSKSLLTKALTFSANDPELMNNLGHNHYCVFEYDEAQKIYETILRNTPNYGPTLLNYGLLMRAMGHISEAREHFINLKSNKHFFLQAMNNLAHLELSLSNFSLGWEYYRFRPSMREIELEVVEKIPENINEKSILIFKDQGIGDEIFFSRFIPRLETHVVEAHSAKLSYYTDDKLSSFWRRSLKNVDIVTVKPDITSFDIIISAGELPRLLFQPGISVPESIEISPLPSALKNIKNQLPQNEKKNIAVTWEAGVIGENSLFKRISPTILGKKLAQVDANIIVIQRNPKNSDIKSLEKSLGKKIFNFSFLNNNLEEMLALLSIVDEYHCVSNTNTHIMAMLGRGCHVYVPHPAEWRWLNEGDRSTWFPKNSLCRQKANGEWPDTFLD